MLDDLLHYSREAVAARVDDNRHRTGDPDHGGSELMMT